MGCDGGLVQWVDSLSLRFEIVPTRSINRLVELFEETAMKRFGQEVLLQVKGRDTLRFAIPPGSRSNVGEILHRVAHTKLPKGTEKPFAVDVKVDGKVLLPTSVNRCYRPPLYAKIELVQNCSHDAFEIPNKSWVMA